MEGARRLGRLSGRSGRIPAKGLPAGWTALRAGVHTASRYSQDPALSPRPASICLPDPGKAWNVTESWWGRPFSPAKVAWGSPRRAWTDHVCVTAVCSSRGWLLAVGQGVSPVPKPKQGRPQEEPGAVRGLSWVPVKHLQWALKGTSMGCGGPRTRTAS